MNEELRMQRVREYGSFLFCPMRNTDCSYRETDKECGREDGCILDDPEYQELQQTIERNRREQQKQKEKRSAFVPPSRPAARNRKAEAWEEIHALEARASELYRKNKPKVADRLLADAMNKRRRLMNDGEKGKEYL